MPFQTELGMNANSRSECYGRAITSTTRINVTPFEAINHFKRYNLNAGFHAEHK